MSLATKYGVRVIWLISVCFISRPMLEVRDDRPRGRHLSFIVLIAIHVAMSYAYARRESYKTIHALVRRYSLDPKWSNLRRTKVQDWESYARVKP